MTDQDKIDHATGCLREVQRQALRGEQMQDYETMQGLFRKIGQLAGMGLDNMQAATESPPVIEKTFEQKAMEDAAARVKAMQHGATATSDAG